MTFPPQAFLTETRIKRFLRQILLLIIRLFYLQVFAAFNFLS